MLCLTGVLVATGIALLAGHRPVSVSAAVTSEPAGTGVAPNQLAQQTTDGATATWVAAENQLPGSRNWRIAGAPATGVIQGFADETYAKAGQSVNLYVSTSAAGFRVEAYRIGYYNGLGGRLVWASPGYAGQQQPACPLTAGVNMVACDNWSPSLTVHITQAFVQGDYLLKLIGSDNEQSYVPLTVWDENSQAAYLVKNDVFTWQAWNTYGGYSFYQGVGTCPANINPPCARARVLSYDRPYDYGQGAADFLTLEAPLVRFVEQHGLDVTYVNDMTVQENPGILANHRALLSPGRDESWSLAERNAVTKANGAGLNLAFFGAAAIVGHVRTQDSPLGPDRQLIDYRDPAADPANGHGDPRDVTGNRWTSPPASWPGSTLIGETFNGTMNGGVRAPLAVADPGAWIFTGTGLAGGSIVADVIGSDVDSLETIPPHPDSVQVLAHSPLSVGDGRPESHAGPTFFSDMTYYTDPTSHAGVWDSGTENWIPALNDCTGSGPCPAGVVGTMTGNVLRLFGLGAAGRTQPSQANWRDFYPSG
ncbi:MAG TPA: N,N-dimethylformamidase beta subunit family domain-containing protein [Pseudonocardiaceae bacterium]